MTNECFHFIAKLNYLTVHFSWSKFIFCIVPKIFMLTLHPSPLRNLTLITANHAVKMSVECGFGVCFKQACPSMKMSIVYMAPYIPPKPIFIIQY